MALARLGCCTPLLYDWYDSGSGHLAHLEDTLALAAAAAVGTRTGDARAWADIAGTKF